MNDGLDRLFFWLADYDCRRKVRLMMGREPKGAPGAVVQPDCVTSHWSVVFAAADQQTQQGVAALDQFCRTYWYPVYSFARRRGYSPEDAQDLTQRFFSNFLEKEYFRRVDVSNKHFRGFLFRAMDHFLINEWKRVHCAKRGGFSSLLSINVNGFEGRYLNQATTKLTPERAYEKSWAAALLGRVFAALRQEYLKAGHAQLFEALADHLWDGDPSFARIGARFGLTEGAARAAMHRFRVRCRQRLRHELARMVKDPDEVDEELRYLSMVVSDAK